jgi:hypothetical protein
MPAQALSRTPAAVLTKYWALRSWQQKENKLELSGEPGRLNLRRGKPMTMNRSVIFAIGALVLALAAAACSSSPAAEPGAADPTAAPTAMETPTQVTLVATPEPTPDTGTDPVSETALTLTSQDVLAIVGDSVALTVEQLQPQAIDSSEAPVPVDAIDEWVITLFQAPETGAAIVFSVMDLATVKDAETVFAEVQIGFTGQTVSVGLGDDSVAFEPNASGIGSIITFIQGDLVVSMTATLPPNGEPLTDLAGLTSLGRTASDRLGGESSAGAQAVLDEVLALWAATSASEYTFEFNWVCFCIREWVSPVSLSVSGGEVVSAMFVESGEPVTDANQLASYVTIEGLFQLLQDAIDQSAESIQVEFHPTDGYPVSAFIDYDARMADEERGFSAANLSLAN